MHARPPPQDMEPQPKRPRMASEANRAIFRHHFPIPNDDQDQQPEPSPGKRRKGRPPKSEARPKHIIDAEAKAAAGRREARKAAREAKAAKRAEKEQLAAAKAAAKRAKAEQRAIKAATPESTLLIEKTPRMKPEKESSSEEPTLVSYDKRTIGQLTRLLKMRSTDMSSIVGATLSCIRALRGQRNYQLDCQEHRKLRTRQTLQHLQQQADHYRMEYQQQRQVNNELRVANGLPPVDFDDQQQPQQQQQQQLKREPAGAFPLGIEP